MAILRLDLIESRAIIHSDAEKDTDEVARSKRVATPFICGSKINVFIIMLYLQLQLSGDHYHADLDDCAKYHIWRSGVDTVIICGNGTAFHPARRRCIRTGNNSC